MTDTSRSSQTHLDWLRSKIEAEGYWFHRMELAPGVVTPGWSDPLIDKLPYFGLPEDLSGMRVLDIGPAEGFFSFEAERRGAAEVIAIDPAPLSIQKFNLCRDALNLRATAYLGNVYDLSPRTYGTFDLVMFYGVLYHLRHPLLALERVLSVASGTVLMQTMTFEDPSLGDEAAAKFHPFGVTSGPADAPSLDPTVFWVPNAACVRDMLLHVGFVGVEQVSTQTGAVYRAKVSSPAKGAPPDEMTAPWS